MKKHTVGLLLPHVGQLKGTQHSLLASRSTFTLRTCTHTNKYKVKIKNMRGLEYSLLGNTHLILGHRKGGVGVSSMGLYCALDI